jgi:hypothetical protein
MMEVRSAKGEKMSTAETVQDEISSLLRQLANPVTAGDSVKSCIRRASMRAGLPYGQTKRLWYREWHDIPAFVADNIRERANIHDRKLKHAAFQTLVAMQNSDPEFFGSCIEALGEILLPGPRHSRHESGGED